MKTLRIIVLLTVVAFPVFADAPRDQYGGFDRDSVIIRDAKTRLQWEREVQFETAVHLAAETDCSARFGGRLPTIKELLTLLDEEPRPRYLEEIGTEVTKLIDVNAFPHQLDNGGLASPVDAPYWTSTTNFETGQVWTLSFADGAMALTDRDAKRHFRCVKD